MTTPTKIELSANAQAAPVPASNLGPLPLVALCPFLTCLWTSTGLPYAPTDVADELIARHLLACHEPELRVLGQLAWDGDLL